MLSTRAIIIAAAFAALVATAVVLLVPRPTPPGDGSLRANQPALAPDPHMDTLSIPAFTLVNQNGDAVTRDAFRGRITVLDFFFSHCPFICPPMAANMKRVQDAMQIAGVDVQIISVSVDPAHDTPERLREYAAEIGADPARWTFLTGDAKTIGSIARSALTHEIQDDPSRSVTLPTGETMSNIGHPSHFLLIGPRAEVIALCPGVVPEQVDLLIDRARRAAAELAALPR